MAEMRELNPRAWIPSLNRYATGFDNLYYHRQMNGEGEWWCYPAGEDEQLDVKIELPTGLKDRNGKEICMGDILKFRGRFYEVVFDDYGQFCLDNKKYHWLENRYSFNSVNIWKGDEILVEIVGNIHEHPELLEAKNVD